MKLWRFIVVLALCSTTAGAQLIAVVYRETVSVPIPGALAAFSLNDFYCDAKAESGMLTIYGKNPGIARVVVVTQQGSEPIDVRVTPAPPSYPSGFIQPLSGEAAAESGLYESRFTSGPSQFENTINLLRREGNRSLRLHLTDTVTTPAVDSSIFALSSVFFQVLTPGRDITFLDQSISNSPLTVDGSVVRGFHLRQNDFLFHVGYTSTANFENLILPSQKEGVAGAGYRFSIGNHASLTPNPHNS